MITRIEFLMKKLNLLKLKPGFIFLPLLMLSGIGCSEKAASGKTVFSYNESSGIASLDPAFAKNQAVMWPVHQLFNTLVEVDSSLNIVPSLAKTWEVNSDATIYTFHIRTDVYFHDDAAFPEGKGRKLTAQDVVYSFKRIIDPRTASSGAWIFNNRIDPSNGFIAIDDSTFRLQLLRPFHPVLGILTMQYCSIVPREAIEKYGKDFRSHPIGTGPFQFGYWDEGQALVLHKNKNYWERDESGRQLPYLDAVKVSFLDNKATEFLEFRQGRLSFINDIDPSFKDEVLTKNARLRTEWEGKVVFQKNPVLNTEYFGILMDDENPDLKNSPLKSRAVRRAINFGIDREKLIMYMRNSVGRPAVAGMVPYGLPSLNAETVRGYHYHPDSSKRLLASAGVNGNTPAVKLITIPTYEDIATFVARQLQDIGLKVQVEVVQKSLLLEQTAKRQALFFRASWIGDYPDAENYMAMFYSKNPAPPNYTGYNNPAFDRLYERALQENNDSIRYRLYREMDQMVIDDAPVVPIYYDEAVHFLQPDVKGYQQNALNLMELRRVRIE